MEQLWDAAKFCVVHWKTVVLICGGVGIIPAAIWYRLVLADEDPADDSYEHKMRDTFLAWLGSTVLLCLIAFFWVIVVAAIILFVIWLFWPRRRVQIAA